MVPATKHDKYITQLCDKIRDEYDVLLTNVKIKKDQRLIGEIDVYARKGTRIDIYEVKCSYRIVKAKKQIKKVRRLLEIEDGNGYFYCGSSDSLFCVKK
ncbi:MAG: hypothetical protein Q8O03_00300 [Nanoarchaeota archaeon]|nr:hypothetical protein [Nanoarchaeota archaeon]